MNTLLKYLRQKSTWAGILSVAAALGVALNPELQEALVALGVAAAGVGLALLDEDKK